MQLAYDDSKWLITDLPHDYEITGTYTSGANGGEGFLPYNVSFYRKHAVLPASWRGSRVEVYVEGALSASQWWLNGQPLASGTMFMSGYTSLILRIDDSPAVVWGGLNVLVAYVDGTKKTGWWYEGAGLYRRVSITSTPLSASIATHGVYAPANVTGAVTPHNPSTPAAGLIAPAVVHPKTLCRNDGATPSTLTVSWSLLDASGAVAASSTAPPLTVPAGSNATAVGPDMVLASAELWSVPRPYLYTLVTSVSLGGSVVDSVSASIGIRAATWDANTGFYLNGQHVKMRGYCDREQSTRYELNYSLPLPRLQDARLPSIATASPQMRTSAPSAPRCPPVWTYCACSSSVVPAATHSVRATTRQSLRSYTSRTASASLSWTRTACLRLSSRALGAPACPNTLATPCKIWPTLCRATSFTPA